MLTTTFAHQCMCCIDRYMYADDLTFDPQVVTHLLHAAKKYEVSALEDTCTTYLRDSLDASNACTLLDQAKYWCDQALAKTCMKIILVKTEECVTAESFVSIRSDTLGDILDAKFITCSEAVLFDACCQWGGRQCAVRGVDASGVNIRRELGGFLYKIRLAYATMDELSLIAEREVLDRSDEAGLWRYQYLVNNKKSDDRELVMPGHFQHEKRYKAPGSEFKIRSLNEKSTKHVIQGRQYKFKFSVQTETESALKVTLEGLLCMMPAGTQTFYIICKSDTANAIMSKKYYSAANISLTANCKFDSPQDLTTTPLTLTLTMGPTSAGNFNFNVDPSTEVVFADDLVSLTVRSLPGSTLTGLPVLGVVYSLS